LVPAAAFAKHIASGALTSEFAAERRWLEGRIERLRTQHTEAVRDKSAAENRSRNLLVKLSAVEAEKEDLGRRLAAEKENTDRAHAEAQAARAEAHLALQCTTDGESGHRSLRGYLDRAEASTRTEVDWVHKLLVDVYRELVARTAPFDTSGEEVGLRFLGWL
jgi:chromosome segregation ATPase